jgi:spore germination cell wall hydrolase CwlJ-like protein
MQPLFRAASFAVASFLFLIGAGTPDLSIPADSSTPVVAAEAPAEAPQTKARMPAIAPASSLPSSEAPKPRRRTLAELVSDYSSSRTDGAQQECLAGAVYFESKGEPLAGQLSVADVILNRTRSGRFPATVCGVVKQRGQFSFVRGGRFPPIARGSLAWRKAVAVARVAMQDLADGSAPKALFFHARRVSPGWRLTRVAAVGNHIFYR